MMKIKFIFSFIIPILQLLIFITAYGAEGGKNPFKIRDEIRISSDDINCNYRHEKVIYDFEYPKLFLQDGYNPLIAFIDEEAQKMTFAEVTSNGSVKVVQSFPSFSDNIWTKWPNVFIKNNTIYLASFLEHSSNENQRIKKFLFNRGNKQLDLQDDRKFTINNRSSLRGFYPYIDKDKYMLVGDYGYFCWSFILHIFGGNPSFRHNISYILEENEISELQKIEENDCVDADLAAYVISKFDVAHSSWVRWIHDRRGLEHDEVIVYSTNIDGKKWTKPIELYSAENTKMFWQINNLSIASGGKSVFVLWQDIKNGIFLTEIKNNNKTENIKIGDVKKTDASYGSFLTEPTIKVESDNDGNVFAVWTNNIGRDYQLFFKARINGQWTEEIVINKGEGEVKLPDIKVDKEGDVHITYIKAVNLNDKVHGTIGGGKYGCFYMKLERR